MKLMAQFADASHHWLCRRATDNSCGKCQVPLNQRLTIRKSLMQMRRFGTSGFGHPDPESQFTVLADQRSIGCSSPVASREIAEFDSGGLAGNRERVMSTPRGQSSTTA